MIRQLFSYISFFFFLGLAAWGGFARAQVACPAVFPNEVPEDEALRRQELDRLLAAAPACLLRADYFAYQGQLLLQQGRYVDALVSIERSLLIDEGQPGVQLDYVLALSKTGDLESARALARQVLARDDAPAAMRTMLEGVLRDGAVRGSGEGAGGAAQARWQWRAHVQSMLGFDSNLNSATSADSINLTLPNGNVSLKLDGSSKPKSGSAWLNSGQVSAQASVDGGVLHVQGDWRERALPGSREFAYSQQDASVLFHSYGQSSWIPRVAFSNFSMGGTTLFTGLAGSLWREYPGAELAPSIAGCTFRSGVEGERRTYAQDVTQNGFYGSVLGTLLCTDGVSQFQLGTQLGRDWANSAYRAGGDQKRLDLRAMWDRQWRWGRTAFEWIASDLRDSKTYSDILGGITRATLRQNLRLSLIKRLNSDERANASGGVYSVTVFEVLQHKSNLELFDMRGESLYSGLRYEFCCFFATDEKYSLACDPRHIQKVCRRINFHTWWC